MLPASGKYNLAEQFRSAASSIPANIAKGQDRFYFQDNI